MDFATSMVSMVFYLKQRTSDNREAKLLVSQMYSDVRYLRRLVQKSQGKGVRRKVSSSRVIEIYREHKRLIRDVHENVKQLVYAAKRKRAFFAVESRIQDTRAIRTELSHICVRVEQYVLWNNLASKLISLAPPPESMDEGPLFELAESAPSLPAEGPDESEALYPSKMASSSYKDVAIKDEELYGPEPVLISYTFGEDKAELRTTEIANARRIQNAPIDCDWSRFGMVCSAKHKYYLFVARHSQNEGQLQLYMFKWDGSFLKKTNRIVNIVNIPADVDLGCFDVTKHTDEKGLCFFLKKQNEPTFYRYLWLYTNGTANRLRDLILNDPNPHYSAEIDWDRWFVYRDTSIRVGTFKIDDSRHILKYTVKDRKLLGPRSMKLIGQYPDMEAACTSVTNDGDVHLMYQITFHQF